MKPTGTNAQIIEQIVNRQHVSTPLPQIGRLIQSKLKNQKVAPKGLRISKTGGVVAAKYKGFSSRELYAGAIKHARTHHILNRVLYGYVMTGRRNAA